MTRTPLKETSEVARTLFRDHLVSGPYERLFLTPDEEVEYVRNYLALLDGILEYKFTIAEYHNLGSSACSRCSATCPPSSSNPRT